MSGAQPLKQANSSFDPRDSGSEMLTDANPLRVALLASEACTRGGVQSFMLRLVEVIAGMLADGQASQGYCISLNDSTQALHDHGSIPDAVSAWGAGRSKARLISRTLFRQTKVDALIVGHLGLAPLAYVLKRVGRTKRYYVILHGIEAWRRISFIDRLALRGATAIVATTNFTAEECQRINRLPNELFRVIPLCADERVTEPSPNFRLDGGFKLLCVSRQDRSEREKGFVHIFEALARLKSSHPQLHLNLVGKGNDQAWLRQEAERIGVAEQVTFWGALSDQDLAAAYRDCDVFVMPSKKEGFGIVFLEAMRRGKPCIGGDHGGTPDVIEHGRSGYLVEYGDVSAMSEHILNLVDESALRQSLGRHGSYLIRDRFAHHEFVANYMRLLR